MVVVAGLGVATETSAAEVVVSGIRVPYDSTTTITSAVQKIGRRFQSGLQPPGNPARRSHHRNVAGRTPETHAAGWTQAAVEKSAAQLLIEAVTGPIRVRPFGCSLMTMTTAGQELAHLNS